MKEIDFSQLGFHYQNIGYSQLGLQYQNIDYSQLGLHYQNIRYSHLGLGVIQVLRSENRPKISRHPPRHSSEQFGFRNFDLPPSPMLKAKGRKISLAALAATFRVVLFPVHELQVGLRCNKNNLK